MAQREAACSASFATMSGLRTIYSRRIAAAIGQENRGKLTWMNESNM